MNEMKTKEEILMKISSNMLNLTRSITSDQQKKLELEITALRWVLGESDNK